MHPGCYSLDLYCDHNNIDHVWDEFPHQFTDELGTRCRAHARKLGWVMHKNGKTSCPKCAGRGIPTTKYMGGWGILDYAREQKEVGK